jgi:hypothetical protein
MARIFRHRRLAISVTVTAGAALLLLGFAASPLLLLALDGWVILDWSRLSDIGQAYDAASALLAGVAVVVVAVSLLMQVRQIRISQVQAARMMHLELMRMLTSDPLLRFTSPSAVGIDEEEWRKNIYTNLFFKYLEMGYEIGHISEESLRQHFTGQFRLIHAREFWRRVGGTFQVDADRKATRRFYDIVEEEHRRALARPEPGIAVRPTKPGPAGEGIAAQPGRPGSARRRSVLRCVVVGAGAGFVAGTAIQRWMSHRWRRGSTQPQEVHSGWPPLSRNQLAVPHRRKEDGPL